MADIDVSLIRPDNKVWLSTVCLRDRRPLVLEGEVACRPFMNPSYGMAKRGVVIFDDDQVLPLCARLRRLLPELPLEGGVVARTEGDVGKVADGSVVIVFALCGGATRGSSDFEANALDKERR